MGKKSLIMLCGLAVLLLGIFFAYNQFAKDKNPIPKDIRKSSTFPLYYPEKLPSNWEIEKNSFDKSTEVLMYRIADKTNAQKNISVSIQPQPKAFNFDKFYKETLAKSTQFTTSLGLAAIGEGEGGYKIGSVATGDSWILITSNAQSVTNNDIRTLLGSLRN